MRRPVASKVVATAFVKVSFGSAVPGVVQAPPQPEAVPLVRCAAGTPKSMKYRCDLPSTVIVSSIRPLIRATGEIVQGLFAETWINPDPTREYVRVGKLAVPRIYHPDWVISFDAAN